MIEQAFLEHIAQEVSLNVAQVVEALRLLEGGATIPFVARYRKDATGNLDEAKLEAIVEQNNYFVGLASRRAAIIESISSQGKLTDELRERIHHTFDRLMLEDLYLPYKKKQRNKATVARDQGLEPLSDFLLAQELSEPSIEEHARTFVRSEKAVASIEEALEGARTILAERFSMDENLRSSIRNRMLTQGKILAHPTKNAEQKKNKFEAYYSFSEPVAKIPSHRFLAVVRGVAQGFLRMELVIDDEAMTNELMSRIVKEPGSPFEAHIRTAFSAAYANPLRPTIESEVLAIVHRRADDDAIRVFRKNAEHLLMSSPAGPVAVLGVFTENASRAHVTVVGEDGVAKDPSVILSSGTQDEIETSEKTILDLIEKHNVKTVAIGNVQGSREIAAFINAVLARNGHDNPPAILVNEAGTSAYTGSKIAQEELPDAETPIRAAAFIARRLQDPLSQLVKIEPRSIGVGQYPHDINQKHLRDGLHRTVVSCVNRVGVDLNSATVHGLHFVSGIQHATAEKIVAQRTALGKFSSRHQLLDIEGVGPKVFEQCAGFLRIVGGENPLDATRIHPEAYPIVDKIAETLQVSVANLIGNKELFDNVELSPFETELFGLHTLEDIRDELLEPARDPRPPFRAPKFLEGVSSIEDLQEGMEMEGVITNVTDFGAFVNVGISQDGLVHLSELSNQFIRDPREVANVGEIVKVKVIKVDKALPRISLSIKALLPQRYERHMPARRHAHKHHGPDDGPRNRNHRDGAGAQQQRRRGKRPQQAKDHMKTNLPKKSEEQGINTMLADQLAALRNQFSR